MRALRVSGPRDVGVVDVPRPTPSRDEVLVGVIATAVCSTDRKFAAREHDAPRILGHEMTGRLPDGTTVGVHPEVTCRSCGWCLAGWHNRCLERRSLGLQRDGGLAEYVAVPTVQVVPLGTVDPVVGSMLEPLACAVHACEAAGIDTGAPAAVVGAGAMGVLCAWVLRAAGSPVVTVQRSPERRDLARRIGLDPVIGPEEDPREVLGESPSTVIVTAPGSDALRWALEHVDTGGVVQSFAGTPGGAPVDANTIHYRHLTLVGSTGSRLSDYERARDLVASGAIDLGRMPHHVVGLDDAPKAIRQRPPDGYLKTVVTLADQSTPRPEKPA